MTNNEKLRPKAEAIKISKLLKALGIYNFPINMKEIILDYSKCRDKHDCSTCQNKDCIVDIIGIALSQDFDGELKKTPKGWVIIYNTNINYPGRINFTIAHEFGHYILHRKLFPNGLQCTKKDIANGNIHKNIECEANEFASFLLMPLDDFRIEARKTPFSVNLFENLSQRYGTSITATMLKWIDMTDKDAMLISSDNGFIDWCIISKSLFQKYLIMPKTRKDTQEVPQDSLTARVYKGEEKRFEANQENIWYNQSRTTEVVFYAPNLEGTLTMVLFNDIQETLEDGEN